jgi:AcrR family transcriptional regulator
MKQQTAGSEDPAPPKARIRDAERTKAALLAAATREFADRGYGSARIDQIVKRAGVSRQVLYYYYGGKEALYVAVLEEAYAGLRAEEARLHLADRDPVEGIRELALSLWRYHTRHPELISLVNTENLHRAKYLKRSARIAGLNSPLIQDFSALIARGVAAGRFRADADAIDTYVTIAAMTFYYLSNHWTLQANFQRDLMAPARLEGWGRHIVDVALRSLEPNLGEDS